MNEILIISSQRSIRVIASTVEQKKEWMDAIQQQIYSNMRRRSTLKDSNTLLKELESAENRPISLGEEAPIWTPDYRVSMCQRCSSDFSITNRRHHCRGCGKVVCSKCSKQNHYLAYLRGKARVCDDCFQDLTKHAIPEQDENNLESIEQNGMDQNKLSSSDPQLNKSKSMEEAMNDYKKIFTKIRRNSSNITTMGTLSNRSSIHFVDDDEFDKEKDKINKYNDDIISNLSESRPNSINRSSSILKNVNINGINQSTNQVINEKSNHNETKNESEEIIIPPNPQPTPSIEQSQSFSRNLNLRQSGRRRVPKVLTEISANDKDSDMSGYMNKKKGKKQWRKHWFVLKNHVLYSFKQSEDIVATESMPVLGYKVQMDHESLTLQLTHQNQPDIHFLCTEKCIEK